MKKILLIALAAVLLVAFCAPAMAATKKVSFYGDVRFNTYWVKKNDDYYAFNNKNTTGDSDNDILWELDNADSRFGAKFSEGPISAGVEIRPDNGSYYRQWWGAWNLGWGTFLVGHTYVPLCLAIGESQFDSESVVVYGSYMDRLRQEQLQLTVPFSMGYLKVAAIKPPRTGPDLYSDGTEVAKLPLNAVLKDLGYTADQFKDMSDPTSASYDPVTVAGINALAANYPSSSSYDTDVTLPQLQACLNLNFAPVSIDLVGSYNRIKLVDAKKDNELTTINAYIYGGRLKLAMGPFYFKGLFILGKNVGNGGELTSSTLKYRNARYDLKTDKDEDSDYTDYGGVIGFKINDMVTAEVGYFAQKTERFKSEQDKNRTYYLVLPITPIKGVTIYPEVGVRDDQDITAADGTVTEQGKRTYFGAYWKINF